MSTSYYNYRNSFQNVFLKTNNDIITIKLYKDQ